MIQWLAFLFLGVIAWGSSFLWIKVALEEVGPVTLVAYRFLFGLATVLLTLVFTRRKVVFHGIQCWLPAIQGIICVAIPITLISWAETRIDSGLAGVLNASMPIWTILIAHFTLHDDRMTVLKIVGILTGFVGIFILLNPDTGKAADLFGQLAVVLAAILYAITVVLTRKYLKGVHPLQSSTVAMISATVVMVLMASVFEAPLAIPQQPMTWLACGWMGIIGMGLAVQVWYYLINEWGASRTSMVTYAFPVAAVALGVVFLGERVSWELAVGGILIIAGIVLINRPVPTKSDSITTI